MSLLSRSSSLEPEEEEIELPNELATLSSRIDERPESFAAGNKDIQVAALQAAKYVFDLALKSEANSRSRIAELLNSLSPDTAPETRSQAKKRLEAGLKPARIPPQLEETPLPELCVDGMDEGQIWTQMELRAQKLCKVLEYALQGTGDDNEIFKESEDESDEEGGGKTAKRKKARAEALNMIIDGDEEGMEVDFDGEDSEEDGEDEEDEDSDEEDSEEVEQDDEDDNEVAEVQEAVEELRDPSSDEQDEIDLDAARITAGKKRRKSKGKGHPELDDGFFDLAAFNAETEEAEARAVSKGRLGRDEDSEDEDAELEDVDMFAPVEGDNLEQETEPLYNDFFAPPPRVAKDSKPKKPSNPESKPKSAVRFNTEVRVKSIKAKGKGLPVSLLYEAGENGDNDENENDDGDSFGENDVGGEDLTSTDTDEQDLEGASEDSMDQDGDFEEGDFPQREAIERLKDDLFADDEEEESGLSTYEKRQAALRAEIEALESENVAQKHWTLMGEATSRSRPQNALLEEDLEFERIMKAVPVITEETVQGLEERIKARILEGRFDDVVRRRTADDKPFLPSRFFELQDTKSKQSLAEIYEDEYTKTKTGTAGTDDRDGKLAKEHEEMAKQWESISYKLDALCNAHFTPKAPKASISTIANVSAATLESALPTTMATSTMLAPEEVFTPSSSDVRSRSELTPAQKRALHNKEKKAKRKQRDALEKSVTKFAKASKGSVKKQKEAALKSVVKSGKGVTVIGKKGKEAASRKKSS